MGSRRWALPSFVDIVLKTSNIFEETTLVRQQMRGDKAMHKRDLVQWHLENDGKMLCRIPDKADSFERLRDKKSCKAKDFTVKIITKMHRLDRKNRKEMREELDQTQQPEMTLVHVSSARLASDVNGLFEKFKNGEIDQTECMKQVNDLKKQTLSQTARQKD